MKKGFTQKIIQSNIDELIAEGYPKIIAVNKAISRARVYYREHNPDNTNFPKHLHPGYIRTLYIDGGEESG